MYVLVGIQSSQNAIKPIAQNTRAVQKVNGIRKNLLIIQIEQLVMKNDFQDLQTILSNNLKSRRFRSDVQSFVKIKFGIVLLEWLLIYVLEGTQLVVKECVI